MLKYGIGLDVGIASVGWAVVGLDDRDKPIGIIDMGARIFPCAEVPKTGASLAEDRRGHRSTRRRIRRHMHRRERIYALLNNTGLLHNVMTQEEKNAFFAKQTEDIYDLRVRALDELITGEEFARILIHISKRRGFKSTRRHGDVEEGKILKAVAENQKRMEQQGYRTAAEMFLRDPAYKEHKRNKEKDYLGTVTRDLVEGEIHAIFASQRAMGSNIATESLEEAYLNILLGQRSFDEGPACGPYSGNKIEQMVGTCSFEAGELRAAKATYSFEYFNLLEKLNHMRLVTPRSSVALTPEQKKVVIDLVFTKENLNYTKIRKALGLDDSVRFNFVSYYEKKPKGKKGSQNEGSSGEASFQKYEDDAKFTFMRCYHAMRKGLGKSFKDYSKADLNRIGQILTLYKTPANIQSHLLEQGFTETVVEQILAIKGSFSGFGHLSVKACDNIIPYLEDGYNYNEACERAGYNFKAHGNTVKSYLLHPENEDYADITSPVAKRSVAQSIKVINAIIRKQGHSPVFINIELAREMAKSHAERQEIEQSMQENAKKNAAIVQEMCQNFGLINPSGHDIVKYKLYKEQNCKCAYSLHTLDINRLFEPGYVEVDHVVPYSISWDDSYANKVLVLSRENQQKGNRLPLEYLTGEAREKFIIWVNSSVRKKAKRDRLLKEAITEDDLKRFKERNLQDTKNISVFLRNYIDDHLLFEETLSGRKKRVTAVNGVVTSHLRKRWNITKERANGDLHHAVDALVVACATDALIQQVTRYYRHNECKYVPAPAENSTYAVDPSTGEVVDKFPYPWPSFRDELGARLSSDPEQVLEDLRLPFYRIHRDELGVIRPIFVSRAPNRKVKGAVHADTIMSGTEKEGTVLKRVPITKLKLDKNGEISGYSEKAKKDDRLLYEALRTQLARYNGDGKKAFEEGFRKPKADGTPGNPVKKVTLEENHGMMIPIRGGYALNDTMVRTDVFYVEGEGYYLVPIYVIDTISPTLPRKACVAGKPYGEWKEMDDKDFLFSLYYNDLVRIKNNKPMTFKRNQPDGTLMPYIETTDIICYYKGINIVNGAINLVTHDNTYHNRVGAKRLLTLEKYTVDILGTYAKVSRERRLPFGGKR